MSFESDLSQKLKRDLEDKEILERFIIYKISQRKVLSKEKIKRFNIRLTHLKEEQKKIRKHFEHSQGSKEVEYKSNLDALRLEAQINSLVRMMTEEDNYCFKEVTQLQEKLLEVQSQIRGLKR